jgi:hypothetical protein
VRALAALLLLAACSAGLPVPAPHTGVRFVGDAQGLAVPEAAKRIDFGRSPKGVIPIMDREMGQGRALSLAGCPAGVVRQQAWGELVLSFTAERFVGWRNGSAAAGQTCAMSS